MVEYLCVWRVCMCVEVFLWMLTCLSICVFMFVHVCVCKYLCVFVCILPILKTNNYNVLSVLLSKNDTCKLEILHIKTYEWRNRTRIIHDGKYQAMYTTNKKHLLKKSFSPKKLLNFKKNLPWINMEKSCKWSFWI